ncbi:MAG: cyanophycinase [Candidatus Aminicenantes bacterium]|nr:cyanophycinase [Candidatus Aminicenantes bacterium]
MTKKSLSDCLVIFLSLVIGSIIPAAAASSDIGPENGALVIVGGAMKDPVILERFMELAGGPEVPVVIIPTAGGADHYNQNWRGLRQFKRAGFENLTLVHTYDRDQADSEEFVRPIKKARGVFFTGGRQWRLVDAYLNTLVHIELWALLERGGVIGGSSAGATIQGSYLVRGDTKTNTIMMGDHTEGMGFIKNTGIDQHLLKRNRQFDLLEVVEAHPDLLGIGIDEDTAIVVRGDRCEVIGQGYVAIYDTSKHIPPSGQFYFLAPGDRFDLKNRQAYRPTRTYEPLDRVKPIKKSEKKKK